MNTIGKFRKVEAEPSGRAYIDSGKIVWEYQGKRIGEIVMNEVRLIGEYTTSEGPVSDDWFIVFYMSKDDWKRISFYVKGREEMLKCISDHLVGEIGPRLVGSTTWATTCLWPSEVAGQPMWDVEELQPVNIRREAESSCWSRSTFYDPSHSGCNVDLGTMRSFRLSGKWHMSIRSTMHSNTKACTAWTSGFSGGKLSSNISWDQ